MDDPALFGEVAAVHALGDIWAMGATPHSALALAVVGLVASALGGRPRVALLGALWITLPFLVLSVAPSPRPFEERYVIFVLPMLLLLMRQ